MMFCKNRVLCRNLFRSLEILPFVSQYILSLLLFVVKNKNLFTLNSEITKLQDNLIIFISCFLSCLVCIVVSSLVYCCSCLVCIVVILCVLVELYVYCFFCFLGAGLLAISQYTEGPATCHLNTSFSWFPCV